MTPNQHRQPAVFLPHGGGPCFFMDWTWGPADTWNATKRFLEKFAGTLPEQPKAMLVISGHWEEPAFTAGAGSRRNSSSTTPASRSTLTGSRGPLPAIRNWRSRVAAMLIKAGLPAGLGPHPRLRPRRFRAAQGGFS